MSARKDITNQIFNDVYVFEFKKEQNTHALYKCLCMLCGSVIDVTYSNLVSGNTKSCSSCGRKTTNYKQDCEIIERLRNGDKKSDIARDFALSRGFKWSAIFSFVAVAFKYNS